jgi:hypothetical protein
MLSSIHLYALVVVLFMSWSEFTTARSSQPTRPLKRVAHPSILSLEVLPRHRISAKSEFNKRHSSPPSNSLLYDDSFRLILSVYNETFHLHMRPNDHLIHPAARINYYTRLPDGREILSRTKPLLRESVLAYWGEVIAEHHSPVRMLEDTAGVIPRPHPADLGWARLIVHDQGSIETGTPPVFEGAFSVNGVIYHVTTRENYLRNKLSFDPPIEIINNMLVIWRESDVMTPEEEYFFKTGRHPTEKVSVPQSCGHDRLEYNQNPMLSTPSLASPLHRLLHPQFLNETIFRRDDSLPTTGASQSNFLNSIGSSIGCPTTQKVLYMGVAADCSYVATYGSQEKAASQILTNWNSASSLYKSTFNVSLGIAELEVRDETCPNTTDPNFPWNVPCTAAELDARLSLFSQWRGTRNNDSLGLWHLMSGCPTGSEVGIAWLSTLCQRNSAGSSGSVVSGTGVSTAGLTEWQVVSHEIGHNFGAIHDCTSGCNATSPCCPLTSSTTCDANSQFVMSPVSGSGEKVFSQCSLGNICSLMQSGQSGSVNTSCLVDPDPNRTVISLQMCGNGIVEAGEDCDPGIGTTSNCCDSATCKFINKAVCDPQSSPCCNAQCTFAPSTQVCRPSINAKCDTAEFCTGNSSSCPADVTAKNGQSCGSNGLACASGQCTSVAVQCQTVGASMGLQAACPAHQKTCQISCQDPTNSQECITLTSLLIDGSPCGYGGTCVTGNCQAAGFLETAKAWYLANLQIAIPVTIVAGLLVLLLVWGIIRGVRRCCGGQKHPRTQPMLPAGTPALIKPDHIRLPSHDRSDYVRDSEGTLSGSSMDVSVAGGHLRSSLNANVKYQYSANNRMNSNNWVDDRLYNGRS